jgi:hypothetical protein
LLSFVDSTPRAYRLKVSNAAPSISTSDGTFPTAGAGGRKLMYLIKGDDGALEKLQEALTEMLLPIGGGFRINRIINRDFRVDTAVPAGVQLIDIVLEIFLPGKAGEAFNETASMEKSTGVRVIGAYEVGEHVVLPLQ